MHIYIYLYAYIINVYTYIYIYFMSTSLHHIYYTSYIHVKNSSLEVFLSRVEKVLLMK